MNLVNGDARKYIPVKKEKDAVITVNPSPEFGRSTVPFSKNNISAFAPDVNRERSFLPASGSSVKDGAQRSNETSAERKLLGHSIIDSAPDVNGRCSIDDLQPTTISKKQSRTASTTYNGGKDRTSTTASKNNISDSAPDVNGRYSIEYNG